MIDNDISDLVEVKDKIESPGIRHTGASFEDVNDVIRKLAPVLNGIDPDLILISCLSIVFLLQRPDIHPEVISDGIRQVSEFVTLYLSKEDGKVN